MTNTRIEKIYREQIVEEITNTFKPKHKEDFIQEIYLILLTNKTDVKTGDERWWITRIIKNYLSWDKYWKKYMNYDTRKSGVDVALLSVADD